MNFSSRKIDKEKVITVTITQNPSNGKGWYNGLVGKKFKVVENKEEKRYHVVIGNIYVTYYFIEENDCKIKKEK